MTRLAAVSAVLLLTGCCDEPLASFCDGDCETYDEWFETCNGGTFTESKCGEYRVLSNLGASVGNDKFFDQSGELVSVYIWSDSGGCWSGPRIDCEKTDKNTFLCPYF
jgi:hypothetical protein